MEIETAATDLVFVRGEGTTYSSEAVFVIPLTILAGERIPMPIIMKNADKFSGLTGVLNYGADLWRFDGLSAADGCLLQNQDNRFIIFTLVH